MNRNGMAIVLFILFLIPGVANADTYVSDCGTLNTPGETYLLTRNITDSTASVCMSITANDVTLDCQGHTIDGIDKSLSTGVSKPYGSSGKNVTLKNCVVSDWRYGIWINGGDKPTITGNRVESSASGIVITSTPGAVVSGNEVTGFTIEGIELRRSADLLISSNRLVGGGYVGRGIYGRIGTKNSVIENNEISGFGSRGIELYILTDGGGNVISGNVISDPHPDAQWGPGGIYVLDLSGAEIKNNVTRDVGSFGIHVEGTGFTISGNESYRNHTGIFVAWVWNEPGTTDSTITDNVVHDNENGISLGSNDRASGNSIYKNVIGITVSGDKNEVRNNTINENEWGMDIHVATNAVIDGNTIKDSKYYGMRFTLGTGSVITGNTVCGSGWWDMAVNTNPSPPVYSASGNRCQTVLDWHDDEVPSGCTYQCLNNPPIADAERRPDRRVRGQRSVSQAGRIRFQ